MPPSLPASDRFSAEVEALDRADGLRYQLSEQGRVLSYAEVLDLWAGDEAFLDFFNALLSGSGYAKYQWETPALSTLSADRPFEFVVLDAPFLPDAPDQVTFADFFDSRHSPGGVVAFPNLGGDALMVVPSPFSGSANYSHLAAFYREAPLVQQRALWQVLGREAKALLSERPIWLSVAGGGVNWLHLRIDSRPKYYRYGPYRAAPAR